VGPEPLTGEHEDLDRLDRGDAGGARPPVDEREFTEDVSRAAEAEYDLGALVGHRARLHVSIEQDHHPVARLTLVHEA